MRIPLTIVLLLPLAVCAQMDIEKNFVTVSSADFSGSFSVSGVLVDSTPYTGTLKLEKWHTFTTPKGNILQSYKMDYKFGEGKSNGVAVYDGSRLYYASGPSETETYYLLLLSKLEFSNEVRASLAKYGAAKSQAEKDHYIEWEGKEPWYGYLDYDSQSYGFFFWSDGIWGQFSTRWSKEVTFPPDSGSWLMLELEEDGSFGSKRAGSLPEGYWESGGFAIEPAGKNVLLRMNHHSSTSPNYRNYYNGTGMMTTHPKTGDNMIVAIMGGPDDSSVGWMEVSGQIMKGEWAPLEGEGRGIEEWAVPENVRVKNSWLFK